MCNHTSTILTEEGHECLNCGLVLGHSWQPVDAPVDCIICPKSPTAWWLEACQQPFEDREF